MNADHEHVAGGIVLNASDASVAGAVDTDDFTADQVAVEKLAFIKRHDVARGKERRARVDLCRVCGLDALEANQQPPLVRSNGR